jgi:predicted phage-related endonuclease
LKQIHELVQGTDAWHAFRLEHFGASEAAAMLGLSKKVKRNELLHAKHTGNAREFSDWVQRNILDYGHEVESLARPHVEVLIGEDLYRVTYSDGKLSCSVDGITLEERVAWEHKQWSESLAAAVQAGEVPDEHMPQGQQILMVTGAEKVIFTVSDGTPEKMVHVEVFPDPEWFERIRAGWEQFDRDLAAYEPPAPTPVVVAKAVETLPAVSVRLDGALSVVSNLDRFGTALRAFVAKIPEKPTTDQEFVDVDAACKALKTAEDALDAAESGALASISSVEDMRRVVADLKNLARSTRLASEKLVERRKVEIKEGIILKAKAAYIGHVEGLKAETEGTWVPLPQPDFAGAAKNKRTMASLQDAVDSVVANAKIEADASARRIRANLACLREDGAGHEFLFADKAQLVGKPLDDLRLLVRSRIDAHKAKEAARLEAERERIRLEEQAKAQREAAAQAAADQAAAEAQARKEREAAQATAPVATRGHVPPHPMPPPAAAPTKRAAPVANEPATLNLTTIGQRLGFTLSAAFISESLGIKHAATDKAARLYRESQFPIICARLCEHIGAVSTAESTACAN